MKQLMSASEIEPAVAAKYVRLQTVGSLERFGTLEQRGVRL